jgi:acetate kinase
LRVLVVNAGSSSLKLRMLDADDSLLVERDLGAAALADGDDLRAAIAEFGSADAIGHRIVHGGSHFSEPVVVDETIVDALHGLVGLAPLHQPPALAVLDAASRALPGTPQVACFDTAFHARMPAAAATYALPEDWRERWPIRRFGFHGLSHEYVARRVAELMPAARGELRIVSCHLGAGASLCAIRGARSIDTTMGFTPLEGLVMATRSGSIDPGLLLWLMAEGSMDSRQIADGLEHGSGLRGLAGSADMREVLKRAGAGEERAALALDVYLHRLRGGIATMAAALGGLDALAFTGGVGERAASIRSKAVAGLRFLGAALDEAANAEASEDRDLSDPGSPVRVFAIAAREDLVIAGGVRAALAER